MYNKMNNIKVGDRFKSTNFLGWIYIIGISNGYVNLLKKHVSCSDYYETIEMNVFKFRFAIGEYHTIIRK